ncbi:MAG: SCO family protein [Yoonia sp.]|nr:SCO family protein [Yoonia sp.]
MAKPKPFQIALMGVASVAVAVTLWANVIQPSFTSTIADKMGRGDYALTATDGTIFTQDTLKGSPSAVFFGFTHCPEVCPTTLGDVATWQDVLKEEDGKELRVFFVTVDPERDTAEMLGDYVSWVPGVVGVTGSVEEVDKAIKSFLIYARKVPLEDGGYTMDHSASVLLFDDKGRLFEPIGYQEGDVRALDKIRRLFAS